MNSDSSVILQTLHVRLIEELRAYAASRKKDVARGAETPELAALLVEKYGHGLARAETFTAGLLDQPSRDLISEVDRLVLEIDPRAPEARQRRWAGRPAGITLD